MSVTVDRMDTIIAETVPVPFDVSLLPHLPYYPELMRVVVALGQAWPVVRREVQHLEDRCAELMASTEQLMTEHERIVQQQAAHDAERDAEQRADKLTILGLVDRLRATDAALERARTTVNGLPERCQLAEAVCSSIDPHRGQRGGQWVWIDATAWDAWRRAVAP